MKPSIRKWLFNLMMLLLGVVSLAAIPTGIFCMVASYYRATGGRMQGMVFGQMTFFDYAGAACLVGGIIGINVLVRFGAKQKRR